MSRLLSLALLCALGANAGLVAPGYVLVPCEDHAPGCPTEPTLVPPIGSQPDYSDLYRQWWEEVSWPGQQSYSAIATDTSGDWVIGRVFLDAGSTLFVYHPDRGIICCRTDEPFGIVAYIDDDGWLMGSDAGEYSPGFLSHVSVLDAMPTNLVYSSFSPFNPNKVRFLNVSGADIGFYSSYLFARSAEGYLYGSGTWYLSYPEDVDMQSRYGAFVLVPVPEPTTITITAFGLAVLIIRVKRR